MKNYILSTELFFTLYVLVNKLWVLLKNYWRRLLIVIAFLLVILDSWIRGLDWSHWAEQGPGAITLWGRSLWDWAGLLLVPLVLAIGGFLLQRNERKTDREIADKRHEIDQQIAKEASMDKTLDEYLKAMTSFLLQENSLLKSKKDDPIRNVARTQTISVIKRLDSNRNQIVFQFLQEANLISTMKGDETNEVQKPIISLARADLSGVDLRWTDLRCANLQGAYLQRANLQRANLQGANLQGANLNWANLLLAKLQEANLQGAIFSDNTILTIDTVEYKGTTMPDGTIFSESTDLKKFTEATEGEYWSDI